MSSPDGAAGGNVPLCSMVRKERPPFGLSKVCFLFFSDQKRRSVYTHYNIDCFEANRGSGKLNSPSFRDGESSSARLCGLDPTTRGPASVQTCFRSCRLLKSLNPHTSFVLLISCSYFHLSPTSRPWTRYLSWMGSNPVSQRPLPAAAAAATRLPSAARAASAVA